MRPWKLSETNYGQVRQQEFEVAVLPLGATEPHNLHLPYGTDMYEANTVADLVCEEAHRRGAKVILLPTIPYGTETNQMEFPLAMNLNPTTLFRVITDLVDSLAYHGIYKVLLLNSHGGNDFKPLLRELHLKTEAKLFLCDWFRIVPDKYDTIFDNADDHAGEMETSVALGYFGDLVAKNEDGSLTADDGEMRSSRFDAVNNAWVSITRPWHLLTTNSGAGNPHLASAEKGRKLMELVVDRLSTFLVELSESDIDERFPFV